MYLAKRRRRAAGGSCRDAKILEIAEGTPEIQRMFAAREPGLDARVRRPGLGAGQFTQGTPSLGAITAPPCGPAVGTIVAAGCGWLAGRAPGSTGVAPRRVSVSRGTRAVADRGVRAGWRVPHRPRPVARLDQRGRDARGQAGGGTAVEHVHG